MMEPAPCIHAAHTLVLLGREGPPSATQKPRTGGIAPMARLPITLACSDYDRTRALRFGLIQPDGIELNYLCQTVEETFWRMARHREYDASEMSMGSYLVRRSHGIEDLVAIPAFPSRYFRHGFFFVNANSGIERPEQLKGKRMGVPEYQITAAVWMRGLL